MSGKILAKARTAMIRGAAVVAVVATYGLGSLGGQVGWGWRRGWW
jgi:hypothetical protein